MEFLELLKSKIVVLDGAMGTMLQNRGLKIGDKPEMLSITSPQVVTDIHIGYLKAGSDVIYTNTFGANRYKMAAYPYKDAIIASIECAKNAVSSYGSGLVAYDMGSLGELMEPIGKLTFDEVYEAYKEQVELATDKVDLFVIETMSDLYELKAAVLAIREHSDKPVIVTMSFDEDGRTFAGCSVEAMVATMEGLKVDALGLNCSLGPNQIGNIVDKLLKYASLPVVVKPNAGMPQIKNGETSYDVGADEFAKVVASYVKRGVRLVGGCCGTDTTYIEKLSCLIQNEPIAPCTSCEKPIIVASGTNCVDLSIPRIVGERLNPTGKKAMKQAIISCDLDYFQEQAVSQTMGGAEILDINVGLPGIDEADMLKRIIKCVQAVSDCPIQIDSSDAKAIEVGLRYVNGKAIVNSVNGDIETMDKIFPLVKKYGALVVGLTIDKNGVPASLEKRIEIAQKIVDHAATYGIMPQDIIIDPLTLTLGAEQGQAQNTLQAIREIKNRLGVKTILGVSNISFGLPERQRINRAFLMMALTNGLDLAIVNPNLESITETFDVYRLIQGYDKDGKNYIEKYSSNINVMDKPHVESKHDLNYCILNSLKKEAESIINDRIRTENGLEIINNEVIPALDVIGEKYEKGIIYLPQLISSSNVAKSVCDIIRNDMDTSHEKRKFTVIIATVEGDVHDIGKNIVKTVLLNYGYDVIDLGRDVSVEEVVKACFKYKPKVVALSALMTTTVKNMARTIKALKEASSNAVICVGGAVLSENVAMEIGADKYTKDPGQLVKYLQKIN